MRAVILTKKKGSVPFLRARARKRVLTPFSLLLLAILTGCGFHQRQAGHATLAPELAVLRIAGAQRTVLDEMRDALVIEAGARITEETPYPLLTLSSETIQSEVLAITAAGTQSDFLLNYRLSYDLRAADGSVLIPSRVIRLQREYTFDKLNVLASERHDEFLRAAMRRDAVRQILRALSSVNPSAHAN
jgi:LPS-assembly lipoprotein